MAFSADCKSYLSNSKFYLLMNFNIKIFGIEITKENHFIVLPAPFLLLYVYFSRNKSVHANNKYAYSQREEIIIINNNVISTF